MSGARSDDSTQQQWKAYTMDKAHQMKRMYLAFSKIGLEERKMGITF